MLAALAAPEPLKPGASHARCGLPARAFANHRGLSGTACHRTQQESGLGCGRSGPWEAVRTGGPGPASEASIDN